MRKRTHLVDAVGLDGGVDEVLDELGTEVLFRDEEKVSTGEQEEGLSAKAQSASRHCETGSSV